MSNYLYWERLTGPLRKALFYRVAIPAFAAAVATFLATGLCGCRDRFALVPPVLSSSAPDPAYSVLAGSWLRPDGGYRLVIGSIGENGVLKAGYFNPSPIHVAHAQASLEGGTVKVFIELRDVNYPGSLYNLAYDRTKDRLEGTYYQAVAKETYAIYFERVKP